MSLVYASGDTDEAEWGVKAGKTLALMKVQLFTEAKPMILSVSTAASSSAAASKGSDDIFSDEE